MNSAKEQIPLLAAACAAQEQAYAPYSHYAVGAAVLAADGNLYTGANVENASFGLTICAERTAVFNMVSAGVREIRAVAVCTMNGVAPCGACRQVMAEFVRADIPVYLVDESGRVQETTLFTLLPHHFGPADLPVS
jgi:cytidine deaminase